MLDIFRLFTHPYGWQQFKRKKLIFYHVLRLVMWQDNIDHGVKESSKGLVHLAREGEGCSLMADENHDGCRKQQSHFFLDMGYL